MDYVIISVESSSTTSAHRYVLVATVLHNSWPIPDTAWPFLADIKAAEEEAAEKLVVGGGGGGGKSGGRKPLSATKVGKGKKPKGGGGGGKEGAGGKDSGGEGLQSSVSLTNVDVGKPHWILRMALKQSVSTSNSTLRFTFTMHTEYCVSLSPCIQNTAFHFHHAYRIFAFHSHHTYMYTQCFIFIIHTCTYMFLNER